MAEIVIMVWVSIPHLGTSDPLGRYWEARRQESDASLLTLGFQGLGVWVQGHGIDLSTRISWIPR